jgi:hypothetical protein
MAPPPEGSARAVETRDAMPDFWFLQLTWTMKSSGLLLNRRADGLFERVGFFKMGRNNYEKTDWRIRGGGTVGLRDWDWYGGLRMCKLTLV